MNALLISLLLLPCIVIAAPFPNVDARAAVKELNGLSENAQNVLGLVIMCISVITILASLFIFCAMDCIIRKISKFFSTAQTALRKKFGKADEWDL